MRLLVVEDERELAALIRDALERAGFAVDLAPDLAQADECIALTGYDVIILDLALPDGDGLSLLRRLRGRGSTLPVLVLTARDGLDDRVTGLDSGADDYLVKPFHVPELIARIRALLRRPDAVLGVILTLGNLALDTTTRQARVDGVDIGLSVRETTLLELLLRRQNRVVPREVLEEKLYSFDAQIGSNVMEVLVHRLRRKLADAAATPYVHTVRGVGYLLTETP
jgi:DNA-binding response OmpR family regulator